MTSVIEDDLLLEEEFAFMQPCMIGQVSAGAFFAFVFGAVGAALGGNQGPAQVLGQIFGAGLGAHAMAAAKASGSGSIDFLHLGLSFGGACTASVVSALALPPHLDFVVLISAVLAALGATAAGSLGSWQFGAQSSDFSTAPKRMVEFCEVGMSAEDIKFFNTVSTNPSEVGMSAELACPG